MDPETIELIAPLLLLLFVWVGAFVVLERYRRRLEKKLMDEMERQLRGEMGIEDESAIREIHIPKGPCPLHAWRYGQTGGMFCVKCKKKAGDIGKDSGRGDYGF